MTLDFGPWLRLSAPELILAVTGFVVLSADLWMKDKRKVGKIGLIGILIALASLTTVFGRTEEIWSRMVMVDGFAGFFKVIFLAIAALIFLSSFDYLAQRRIPAGEFYVLIIFATLGMAFMASSLDLITIWLGLETLSLASYALAGLLRGDDRSTEASIKYVLIGALTSSVILFGISLIFGITGTTHLGDIGAALTAGTGMDAVLMAGMMFLIAGFGVKIAIVPFHMWAPDIYDGAPTPVAAFLITASEAAAFAAILRIFLVGLPVIQTEWTLIFAILAAVTMTYGNVTAIAQTGIKRMLAYSAIAQAGYILVGIAVATSLAVSAMLYYLLVYAFMTIGAFAVVIMLQNHTRAELISDFRGLSQRSPIIAFALTVYMLSLIGIPPTAGFVGKFFLFRAAIADGMVWLALFMVVNSVISVPYYWNIVRTMYLTEAEDTSPLPAPASLRWVVGITLTATLLLGLFPERFVRLVEAVTVLPGL